MAARTRQVGIPRSRLLGTADQNRHCYPVAVASRIWRPGRAVRLIRRWPTKPRNEPSSPICIAYLAFQSRDLLLTYALSDAPGESSATRTKLGLHVCRSLLSALSECAWHGRSLISSLRNYRVLKNAMSETLSSDASFNP
jgi:hypothetical protein